MASYEDSINWQIRDSLERLSSLTNSRTIRKNGRRINNLLISITSIQVAVDKLVEQPQIPKYNDALYQLRKSLNQVVDAIEDLECEQYTEWVSTPNRFLDPFEQAILQAH